jgi:aryl-alcohol dehydrogenase-like predicted oxidoreductase
MERREFGQLGTVSSLAIGGGGIGQVWGPTTRDEAVATVRAAIDAGITLIDVAPAYGRGEAELVVGEAFGGVLPAGVQIATKCALFAPWSTVAAELQGAAGDDQRIIGIFERSLAESLRRLRLSRVDLLFLHDQIVPDGEPSAEPGTPRSLFVEAVRPALEHLVSGGQVGAWAISARGVGQALVDTLGEAPTPAAAQIVTNVLTWFLRSDASTPGTREWLAVAERRGVGVMGIQPTQGGALTEAFDRPVNAANTALYQQAAPFRAVAAELGTTPATLAHRYALAIPRVSTVTLGVKNRTELREALAAEAAGPLEADLVALIDARMSQAD